MLADRRCHATIPVSDVEAVRSFYEGTLGFEPLEENPAAVIYRAGSGSVFAVTRSSGRASGSHTQMGFTVDDIEDEVADLRRRGVTFEEYDVPGLKTEGGIARTGPNRAAWFKDPEGNLIGLIEFGRAES
ncbi:MAG: VOC family protein [Chloroflexi bacterium]|nr:MAG: VOC family protein [Chloroflexota bacterium]